MICFNINRPKEHEWKKILLFHKKSIFWNVGIIAELKYNKINLNYIPILNSV